ncbi:MAG: hypothetical protein PHU14_01965 [Methylovulum sp.]|nr:hypothetical protein [Methylovulum sp.]
MSSRTELERQLAREIHHLPMGVMEAMLHLALSIKKTDPAQAIGQAENAGLISSPTLKEADTSLSAGTALQNFLKKYESDPIDIDTRIFEQDRASEITGALRILRTASRHV